MREAPVEPLSGSKLALLTGAWALAVLVAITAVLYGLTPIFQQRDQNALLRTTQADIQQAANEALTIEGATTPTKAPKLGAAVGILEVGGIQLQQVTVEGVDASETAQGPGHVPGTAGLGQPGNAVIVGRRSVFAGPFAPIGDLHQGDEILVSTRQGQTVYVVDHVGNHTLNDGVPSAGGNQYATDAAPKDPLADQTVYASDVFGATADNRLTLVTSASPAPWNQSEATVVVAKMRNRPFPPTPQNGRSDSQLGRSGDESAWAPMLLAIIFLDLAVVAAILLYRRMSPRSAYLLTAAPLLVGVILVAETLTRLLPAWY